MNYQEGASNHGAALTDHRPGPQVQVPGDGLSAVLVDKLALPIGCPAFGDPRPEVDAALSRDDGLGFDAQIGGGGDGFVNGDVGVDVVRESTRDARHRRFERVAQLLVDVGSVGQAFPECRQSLPKEDSGYIAIFALLHCSTIDWGFLSKLTVQTQVLSTPHILWV